MKGEKEEEKENDIKKFTFCKSIQCFDRIVAKIN